MNYKKGFMIIEIMWALTVVFLLVITVGTALALSRRLQNDGRVRQIALDSASEALEIITAIQGEEFVKPGTTACTPLAGYSTCWTDKGWGESSAPLKLEPDALTWKLTTIKAGELGYPDCFKVQTEPDLYRSIKIYNQGTSRPNDIKLITVDVWWDKCSTNKKVSLSTILTAWKN